jgi:hypothetical protein
MCTRKHKSSIQYEVSIKLMQNFEFHKIFTYKHIYIYIYIYINNFSLNNKLCGVNTYEGVSEVSGLAAWSENCK